MRALKLVVVVTIGLGGCDGAEQEEITGGLTGTADTGIGEPGAEEPDGTTAADACPATQLVDESNISAIRSLRSDATHLYYVWWPCDLDDCPPDQDDEVRAVPKAGGTPTTLAFEPGSIPFEIAVGSGYVYWVRWSDRSVMRVPTDGCEEPEVFYQAPGFRAFIAANDDGVYWRTLDENDQWSLLERLPHAGGDVETVAILPPDSSFSLLDDERLYVLTGFNSADAHLNAVDLDTGEIQRLTENRESFGGGFFTQDADALWWGNNGLRRLAKSGGEPETITDDLSYDVGSNGELALYYNFEPEELRAVPVTGGESTVVATSACNLFGTWLERVVDDDALYWSSGHDIFAVPLPN
jgi:hypothetical protein